MTIKETVFSLDLTREDKYPVVKFRLNDNKVQKITFRLKNNGRDVDLEREIGDQFKPVFECVFRDKTFSRDDTNYNWEIKREGKLYTFTYYLTKDVLNKSGIACYYFALETPEGLRITTPTLKMVIDCDFKEGGKPSENYVSSFEELEKEYKVLNEKIEEMKELFQTAIDDGGVTPEVIQARETADGTKYDRLKDRLNAQDKKFQDAIDKNKHHHVDIEDFKHLAEDYETGKDYTKVIQAAIDYASDNGIRIINIPEIDVWIKVDSNGGIKMKDNQTLMMSRNAKLRAIPNKDNWYRIINVYNKRNVVICGGELIGERDKHQATTGQMGFGVEVAGSTDVIVKDVVAHNFWGDGIIVMESDELGESQNVSVIDCHAYNNRRQGMSVTGLVGGLIHNNHFHDTNGHSDINPVEPSAGLDIEPNTNRKCVDIIVSNNRLSENKVGILLYNEFEGGVCEDIILVGNNTKKNTDSGIRIVGCRFVTLASNNSHHNKGAGLVTERCHAITGSSEEYHHNERSGMQLSQTTGSSFFSVNSQLNTQNGILLTESFANSISGICNGNKGNGVRIHKSSFNSVDSSTVSGNKEDNILIMEFSSKNKISDNKIRRAKGSGIIRSANGNELIVDKNHFSYVNVGDIIKIVLRSGTGNQAVITELQPNSRKIIVDTPITGVQAESIFDIYDQGSATIGYNVNAATCSENVFNSNFFDGIEQNLDSGSNTFRRNEKGLSINNWIYPSLQNGWGSVDNKGFQYRIDGNSIILRGAIRGGRANSIITKIPVKFSVLQTAMAYQEGKGALAILIDKEGTVYIPEFNESLGINPIHIPQITMELN